jgi:hypothetical protein
MRVKGCRIIQNENIRTPYFGQPTRLVGGKSRPLKNSFSLIYTNFLTHRRACSLNHENSASGPQTVYDLPTKVGTFTSPGWVPQKVHDGRSQEFFKALKSRWACARDPSKNDHCRGWRARFREERTIYGPGASLQGVSSRGMWASTSPNSSKQAAFWLAGIRIKAVCVAGSVSMAPPCFSTTKRVTHNISTWSLACSVGDISGWFGWLAYLI